jgi:hypothetical protein
MMGHTRLLVPGTYHTSTSVPPGPPGGYQLLTDCPSATTGPRRESVIHDVKHVGEPTYERVVATRRRIQYFAVLGLDLHGIY